MNKLSKIKKQQLKRPKIKKRDKIGKLALGRSGKNQNCPKRVTEKQTTHKITNQSIFKKKSIKIDKNLRKKKDKKDL